MDNRDTEYGRGTTTDFLRSLPNRFVVNSFSKPFTSPVIGGHVNKNVRYGSGDAAAVAAAP